MPEDVGSGDLPDPTEPPARYRLPLALRLLVILLVAAGAVLTILVGLPLARLLGVELSQLQGAGFEPTIRTMTIVLIYAASQFLLI